jgi:hypothetical protein
MEGFDVLTLRFSCKRLMLSISEMQGLLADLKDLCNSTETYILNYQCWTNPSSVAKTSGKAQYNDALTLRWKGGVHRHRDQSWIRQR